MKRDSSPLPGSSAARELDTTASKYKAFLKSPSTTNQMIRCSRDRIAYANLGFRTLRRRPVMGMAPGLASPD